MSLGFLAVYAVNMVSLSDFLNFLKLLKTVLELDGPFLLLDEFVLSAMVLNHIIYLLVIILFDERRVPLNCKMDFLEEVFNVLL